jgi:hypothetical protein
MLENKVRDWSEKPNRVTHRSAKQAASDLLFVPNEKPMHRNTLQLVTAAASFLRCPDRNYEGSGVFENACRER